MGIYIMWLDESSLNNNNISNNIKNIGNNNNISNNTTASTICTTTDGNDNTKKKTKKKNQMKLNKDMNENMNWNNDKRKMRIGNKKYISFLFVNYVICYFSVPFFLSMERNAVCLGLKRAQ